MAGQLASSLLEVCHAAASTFKGEAHAALTADAAHIRISYWHALLTEGDRFVHATWGLAWSQLAGAGKSAFEELHHALVGTLPIPAVVGGAGVP